MSDMSIGKSGGAGLLWIRIAVVYFVVGVVLGIVMGAKGDVSLVSVHSHLNLLGWEALALTGLIYQLFPELGGNRLAKAQFWLHNAGLPVLLLSLVAREQGSTRVEPLIGGASFVIGAAVVIFALNIVVYGRTGNAR